MFEMNDALEEMEKLRRQYEEQIKELINDQRKPESLAYLVLIAYVQEVWANLARSIAVTEEELNSIAEIQTTFLEIMIRQTRKDIKKLKDARDFIKKKAQYSLSLTDESTDEQIVGIPDIDMPEWLKDVNIDLELLSKEVDTMMFVEEIQDHERFIASFVGKINVGVQQRQT